MMRLFPRMLCYKRDEISINVEDTHLEYNWKNTVPFIPPISRGIVIKVYDGDTITIASKLPNTEEPVYRFQIRLAGIDSPELKSKNIEEMEAAKISQQALQNLILNKEVILKNNQTEKYGRILSTVYCDELCVNEWLLKNYYAVKYNGKTKHAPTSWIKYQSTGKFI
jgi:endonuclease YncB( thermonuclease family)